MNNFTPRNQFMPYFNNNPTPGASAATSTNNIVWVQGLEGAKAWQLTPNSIVILLDSEVEGKMYIKVSDNIGMTSLRVFNYKEEVAPPAVTVNQNLDLSDYVKKDELSALIKELIKPNEQSIPTTTTTTTVVKQPVQQPKVVTVSK